MSKPKIQNDVMSIGKELYLVDDGFVHLYHISVIENATPIYPVISDGDRLSWDDGNNDILMDDIDNCVMMYNVVTTNKQLIDSDRKTIRNVYNKSRTKLFDTNYVLLVKFSAKSNRIDELLLVPVNCGLWYEMGDSNNSISRDGCLSIPLSLDLQFAPIYNKSYAKSADKNYMRSHTYFISYHHDTMFRTLQLFRNKITSAIWSHSSLQSF